jgi:hypothetical protein
MSKEKVYMVCDRHNAKAAECGAWDVGVEHMGSCSGRILREDGSEIGSHSSSSFGWLRLDLARKLPDPSAEAFRAAFPPGPANTSPANMADLLSRMDPAKLREAVEQINEKETENGR